jgi:hypothetical protein
MFKLNKQRVNELLPMLKHHAMNAYGDGNIAPGILNLSAECK